MTSRTIAPASTSTPPKAQYAPLSVRRVPGAPRRLLNGVNPCRVAGSGVRPVALPFDGSVFVLAASGCEQLRKRTASDVCQTTTTTTSNGGCKISPVLLETIRRQAAALEQQSAALERSLKELERSLCTGAAENTNHD